MFNWCAIAGTWNVGLILKPLKPKQVVPVSMAQVLDGIECVLICWTVTLCSPLAMWCREAACALAAPYRLPNGLPRRGVAFQLTPAPNTCCCRYPTTAACGWSREWTLAMPTSFIMVSVSKGLVHASACVRCLKGMRAGALAHHPSSVRQFHGMPV